MAQDQELTPLQKAYAAIGRLRGKVERLENTAREPIAIVGMGCRLPGGVHDPESFWNLLREGRDAITEIPSDRWDVEAYYDPRPGQPGKAYTRHGGFLAGVENFDAGFFGISGREAESMDPQQRLLLEVAWEALEHAGIPPSRLSGTAAGVYVGVTSSDYALLQVERADPAQAHPYFNTGTPLNACAGRLAYVLGLQGPCMAVDTACSSSLSALHLACTGLRAGECDLALAGGVNLILTPRLNVTLSAAGMMAPDGRCKTFDAAANGYVRGEGCGLVVLKRYSDAVAAGDTVLALIRASGVNQDGASGGFTVPNGVAQQKLIRQVLAKAKLAPGDIDYVEAHGTGTALGDPIELNSLGTVLGRAEGRTQPLRVGSVKSNIGHLESAAGAAGLIKLVLALRHGELPPSLHIRQPTPQVDWEALKLQAVTEATPWPAIAGKPRLAGLSSFGASGSNAHLVVEEAPPVAPRNPVEYERPVHVLALSAKSDAALKALAEAYRHRLAQDPPPAWADVCFSANTGRTHFRHRLALYADSAERAGLRLAAFGAGETSLGLYAGRQPAAKPPRPVFLFSGQGSVYRGMGRDLYGSQPVFRAAIDACAEILASRWDRPLQAVLFPEPGGEDLLQQAVYAQPALFALQYALARLWQSFGLEPAAVFGHSLGEYCAACVAGVFSLEDGLNLVAERARLMQALPEAGDMAAVFAEESRVAEALAPYAGELCIAVFNGPHNSVVSGREDALNQVLARFAAEGIETRTLAVTHAFHSPLMDSLLDEFERYARRVTFHAPTLPLVSDLTGLPLNPGEIPDAAYWRRHCREPVRYAAGLAALLERDFDLFLEIGPGPVLCNLGRHAAPDAAWLPSLLRQQDDWSVLSGSLAEAYALGADIDWAGVDAAFVRQRIPVPTYAFQRKPYWIFPREATMTHTPQATAHTPQDPREARREAVLARLLGLFSGMLRAEPAEIDIHVPFLEMGADSLVLVEGARVVDDNFGVKLEIRQFFEEITTIDALAGYIAERTATVDAPVPLAAPVVPVSVAAVATPMVPAAAPVSTPAVSAPVPIFPVAPQSHPVEPVPAAGFQPMAARPGAVPAFRPAGGGTGVENILLAQMQLMAQQLAVLQGVPMLPAADPQPSAAIPIGAAPVQAEVAAPAQPSAAPQAAPVPAPVSVPAPAKAEDRSSPLRALANPITPTTGGLTPRQSQHLADLIDRYQQKTPQSKALAQACRAGLADSRASIGFRFSTKEILYPISGVESTGSRMRDVDGNTYVDLTMGFGVLLFGSRPEFMKGVIEAEVARGIQLGPRSDLMLEITRLFTELTGHERVAFTNSGTEAVMIALRLARTTTGRDKIAMFEGSYHGHSDGTLGKTVRVNGELRSEPAAPGVPANLAKDILVLEYGTPETLEILRAHAHELAAVLVEPVQSRRLDFQPVEFLRELRALTEQTGVTLIFDEMISGFRAHPGGAQALFGIEADLATYGKIIGGGMPIGAVAGKRRWMDGIDGGFWQYGDNSYPNATRTYFGGTFCQHPWAMGACLAALRHLKAEGPALQERINRRTAEFAATLNAYFHGEALPLRVSYFSSVFRLEFSGNLELLYYHLLLRGVYIWEWRNCFLSAAHTDEDLALVVQAVKDSVEAMREGGFLPERPSGGPGGGLRGDGGTAAPVPTGGVAAGTGGRESSASVAVPTEAARRAWFRNSSKLSHRDTAWSETAAGPGAARRGLDFGLFYFGNYDAAFASGKYDVLLEGARYADREGFVSLWIPERHFNEFGGFSPNPSVLAAALARETQHLQLRAGSVVLPLHDPIRVAEEWALVDNLSDGRVGIGFASGWHPNDFVFAPDAYGKHRELTFEGLDTVRRLWRGETITRRGGKDASVELGIFPRPKQAELPCWLTIVNNPDTYRKAGAMGVGVLTNLMGQALDDLAANIATYREALAEHGHDPDSGRVTVLIHTYLHDDAGAAIREARQPMCDYLQSSIELFQRMAGNEGPARDIDRLSADDKAYIVGKAYEKYVESSALIGSPATVAPIVERLIGIGVDELACFVDFGVPRDLVLAGLPLIKQLKERYRGGVAGVEAAPLGEAQKQLWILARLDADGCRAYNDPAALSFKGPLDREALRRALEQVVARHETLRTRFDEAGEQQLIQPPGPVDLPCTDLSGEADPEAALRDWQANNNRHLFDFGQGPLFYGDLFALGDDWHVLVLSAHHIVSDGPSMTALCGDLMACYAANLQGAQPELPAALQFRDFVRWQREQAGTPAMAAHEAYWLGQFAGPLPVLDLPYDRPRPDIKTYHGARAWSAIGPGLLAALRKLGAAHGATPYMVLLAVYSAWLHRISGQNQLVVGAPYTGRGLDGGHTLVGYCVHLLPIVSEVADNTGFVEHLRRVRSSLLDAYAHQDYPFARLVDRLNPKRDISRAPLVNTIFNLERLDDSHEVAGLRVETQPQPVTYTRVDLTLTANLRGDRVVLECDYNTDLFDAATIRRWLGQYLTLLEAVAANPNQPLVGLPLLNAVERQTQILDWNATAAPVPPVCLHRLWEESVARHPDRIALVDEGQDGYALSYAELNRRANRLAHYLRGLGIGPERRVGICLERGWPLLVALLGTLKAGGAYVPMDPAYPAARLELLGSDAQVSVWLTHSALLERVSPGAARVCCLDRDAAAIAQESAANPTGGASPANLAYVIYTSGSTGKPKGAMIAHAGLVNYLTWAAGAYQVEMGDGAPVLGSIGFDATVTSLFVPLLAGKRVVLLPDGEEFAALAALNRSPYRFSFVKLTPAHLEILNTLRAHGEADPHLTRYLVLGGEALPGASLDPWFRDTATRAVNEYGPTETVVGCCVYDTDQPVGGAVPIGRPIQGTRLYVLDRHGQPTPPGVPGELYIGGAGVARGYLDRPATTAGVFVPDPHAAEFGQPGARVYKTGDRVRYEADGTLIFLGRIDRQIKLHGFRIELGEIESVLADRPEVRDAAVLLREDQPGQPRLVGYVSPAVGAALDAANLRRELKSLLPEYMVPAVIVIMPELPLTAHGKVDRAALPVPDSARPDSAAHYIAPRDEREQRIAAVWCEVLGLERVGIHDNFFDLGGNSLAILHVYRRLEPLLGADFQVVELFKYPTVAALAAHLGGAAEQPDYAGVQDRAGRHKAALASQATRRRQHRA